jgi:sugar/nucleoside kinase (ribokinase family)
VPATAPRILCVGISVHDLIFRVGAIAARGSKANGEGKRVREALRFAAAAAALKCSRHGGGGPLHRNALKLKDFCADGPRARPWLRRDYGLAIE